MESDILTPVFFLTTNLKVLIYKSKVWTKFGGADDDVDDQVAGGLVGSSNARFKWKAMTVQTLVFIWRAVIAALRSLFVPQH